MKFPGKRKSKHYFPVNARDPLLQQIQPDNESNVAWVVGIDQTLVDIEAKVDEAFIVRYGLSAGHSLVSWLRPELYIPSVLTFAM